MHNSIKLIATICFLSASIAAQDRGLALNKIKDLRQTATALEKIILAPAAEDIIAAERQGLQAFRLMPRDDTAFTSIVVAGLIIPSSGRLKNTDMAPISNCKTAT